MRRRVSQSAAVFAAALTGTNAKEFQAGQTIVSQGEECTDVYYIEKGMVKLTLVSNRGKGAVLGILGQGDFFGEACIGGRCRVFDVSDRTCAESDSRHQAEVDDSAGGGESSAVGALHHIIC